VGLSLVQLVPHGRGAGPRPALTVFLRLGDPISLRVEQRPRPLGAGGARRRYALDGSPATSPHTHGITRHNPLTSRGRVILSCLARHSWCLAPATPGVATAAKQDLPIPALRVPWRQRHAWLASQPAEAGVGGGNQAQGGFVVVLCGMSSLCMLTMCATRRRAIDINPFLRYPLRASRRRQRKRSKHGRPRKASSGRRRRLRGSRWSRSESSNANATQT
jgi:hypothetical protein